MVKNLLASAGDVGSMLGSGRSPGGNGTPLQCSCLKNSMDRGARCAAVAELDTTEHTHTHTHTHYQESTYKTSPKWNREESDTTERLN